MLYDLIGVHMNLQVNLPDELHWKMKELKMRLRCRSWTEFFSALAELFDNGLFDSDGKAHVLVRHHKGNTKVLKVYKKRSEAIHEKHRMQTNANYEPQTSAWVFKGAKYEMVEVDWS